MKGLMRINKFWWNLFLIFLILMGVIVCNQSESSGQINDELFNDSPITDAVKAHQEKEKNDASIKRSRHVQTKLNLLDKQKTPLINQLPPGFAPDVPPLLTPSNIQEDPIVLNLFGDVTLRAIKDRLEIRSGNRYSWFGHVEGVKESQVILVVEEGNLAGSVLVSGKNYQIRPTGGGDHAIYEVDESAYPPHAYPKEIEMGNNPTVSSPQASLSTNLFTNTTTVTTAACCDNGTIIDVMVVYTPAAATASGNIASEIQLAVDSANVAYLNSGINQRLRLVYTAQVPYTETGNATTDLSRLENPNDGYMDEVHALRNTYHADLVSLFVETMTSWAGYASIMTSVSPSFGPYAFSVVRRIYASPKVFPHELGHNMGAGHDRATGCTGAFSYSCGYVDPNKTFDTIMAYQTTTSVNIPYFSNPLVSYNGVPTGIDETQPNSADNAKTLNNSAYTVSNFRQSDGTGFYLTGSMTVARAQHSATFLPNGKVLVTGGMNSSTTFLSSTELYDPATGLFTATGSMTLARASHTATLLPNGKVLITGGYNGTYLSSAELYDPATGSYTATGAMIFRRAYHTATLLPNGKVLITGGFSGAYYPSSAELYDPATGLFTATGAMIFPRTNHTATLLPNGKVLITGGYNGGTTYLSSAELYDPATGSYTATGSLTVARAYHTATLLPNGLVLVTGSPNSLTAELYDPATGLFTATGSMTVFRIYSTATLLPNGLVLVIGGGVSSSSEAYNPATGLFTIDGGAMTYERSNHTSTLLPNGKVLVTGGIGVSYQSSAELYVSLAVSDLIAPTPGLFIINGGAPSTNSQDVTLSFSATDNIGVIGYFASESPVVPSPLAEYWMPTVSNSIYSGIVSFRLSSGGGAKIIYVWFKDIAGNISNVVFTSINYNPIVSRILCEFVEPG
jgi:hypothetical protein